MFETLCAYLTPAQIKEILHEMEAILDAPFGEWPRTEQDVYIELCAVLRGLTDEA